MRNLQVELLGFPIPPPGGYKTIVVDPPWPCVTGGHPSTKGVFAVANIRERYSVMSLLDIMGLPMDYLAAEDCHCFLWTNQGYLPKAFDCLSAWGFSYRFLMTWVKPAGPQMPGYPCYNSEFILYGNRGKMTGPAQSPPFVETKDFFAAFPAEQGRHSEKPSYFYQLLERVTPEPRIDLFARRRHPGFDAWGDEVEDFVQTNLGLG